jgi:uncharacterized membrane protein (DUF485 family)
MTMHNGYDSSASATAASIFITIIIVLAISQSTAPIIITSAYAQFARQKGNQYSKKKQEEEQRASDLMLDYIHAMQYKAKQ